MSPRPRLSPRRRLVFWAAYLLLLGVVPQAISVAWRSQVMYRDIKSSHWSLIGKMYRFDPELGYAPIPGSLAYWRVAPGMDVPVRHDRDGFRVPEPAPAATPGRHPRIMALGCSATAGDACRAEDVYPYRVAEALHGQAMNAAVCGYGLAQMLLRARRLLPEQRPDLLLVQYADWLVARSQTQYAPSRLGTVPSPYFFKAEDSTIRVQPAVFSTNLFTLPAWQYAGYRGGPFDRLSFLVRVGVPLFLREDVAFSALAVRRAFGAVPPPTPDGDAIVHSVYTELAGLCAATGTRMVVVILGPVDRPDRRTFLDQLEGVQVVDAEAALWRELRRSLPEGRALEADDYMKRYGHWHGTPPVLVDSHPNPLAHAVIAEEIVRALGPS